MGKNLKGKKLGKGLSQRKSDGLYQGRISLNNRTEYVYSRTLSECKEKLEEARLKLLREEKGERPGVTLEMWFDEWFNVYKKPTLKSESSSKVYYRKMRNTFIKELGQKRVDKITQMDLQIASNSLVEHYQASSVRESLSVLKEVFDMAVVNKIIPVSPCVMVKVKNMDSKTDRRVMTEEEQEVFLEVAKGDYYCEVYQFLLLTGVRIGELSALTWEDIDFKEKEIYISKSLSVCYDDGKKIEEIVAPKTMNSFRKIPFFAGMEEVLAAWKIKQDQCKKKLKDRWRCPEEYGDLVFTTSLGSPITRYILAPKINKMVKEINLRELTLAFQEKREPKNFLPLHPHAFRHTFATRCMEKDLNPLFVQKIMGHSNYSTTVGYTHVLDKVKVKEVSKAGNFLS